MIRVFLRRWLGVGEAVNLAQDGNWVVSTFSQMSGGKGPAIPIEIAFMNDGTLRWRLQPKAEALKPIPCNDMCGAG